MVGAHPSQPESCQFASCPRLVSCDRMGSIDLFDRFLHLFRERRSPDFRFFPGGRAMRAAALRQEPASRRGLPPASPHQNVCLPGREILGVVAVILGRKTPLLGPAFVGLSVGARKLGPKPRTVATRSCRAPGVPTFARSFHSRFIVCSRDAKKHCSRRERFVQTSQVSRRLSTTPRHACNQAKSFEALLLAERDSGGRLPVVSYWLVNFLVSILLASLA